MQLILPAAGLSTRFPNLPPKWMLTHPSGNMMATEALRGLNLDDFAGVHIGILKEHLLAHPCEERINQQFATLGLADKLHLWVIERPTASQPETIATILRMAKISGAIFCKDIDNYFTLKATPNNTVAVGSLSEYRNINAENKSYAVIDPAGKIQNIAEKKIISDFFCVGGYGFQSAQQFLEYFEQLQGRKDLYVSDIIAAMLQDHIIFAPLPASSYQDWGTLEDWEHFKGGSNA